MPTYAELLEQARQAAQKVEPVVFGSLAPQQQPTLLERLGQTWPARLGRSLYDAATLPGDVYAGRVDPRSDEGIGRAADLAGLVMGGTFSGAPFGALGAGPVGRRLGRRDFDNLLKKQRAAEAESARSHGPETVKWAAVRDSGGNVYEGRIHHDARIEARLANPEIGPDTHLRDGFTTSRGRFVSREEAAELAERAHQVGAGYVDETGWLDAADYLRPDELTSWPTRNQPQSRPSGEPGWIQRARDRLAQRGAEPGAPASPEPAQPRGWLGELLRRAQEK